ncbi:hypothetical protein ACRZ5O_20630 [Pseudomonas protegens]|uniref:hypothetical protein n=1 Tax=Pseudomonas protegens TaxID=380021 RepID=UPI002DB6C10D|nr:hypothetical protein [Pseudomonas protegens]WRV89289.1 hypothetical protein VP719_20315 [Pseudomonas protegens]
MHDDSHSPDCSCCLDHASAHQGVLDTLELMAGHPEASEDDIVQLLQERGYSAIAAEKLNVFVPSALAWIVLKRLGVEHLPNHFIALDEAGQEVRIPVADQHYFTAALTLAYDTFENGWSQVLPRKTYEMVAGRSAEMAMANEALYAGESLQGSTLEPLQLLRLDAQAALT